MYRITLINMPFANLRLPSIALAQLTSVVEDRLGERVRVRSLHLNHEVANYLGLEFYETLTSALEANNSGLGDWLFRQVAFPDEPDNTDEYWRRYFPGSGPELEERKRRVIEKRAGLERFLTKLVKRHRLHREHLVGLTTMFAQNTACFALARLIKTLNPDTVVALGGANCEDPMGRELARHVESLDYVFSGPGLVSFPLVVEHLIDGDRASCEDVRGVFSRDNVDRHLGMWVGQELPIEVPVPLDYGSFLDSVDRHLPRDRVQPALTFETSRGCWWGERSHCTFCGLNGSTMKYRSMPPDQALALFRDMFERYGDRVDRYESVDNILPREYLTDVFPELETPPGASIFYEVKADLKPGEMEILAGAGVTEIQPGIESLSSSTLKLMGKGTTAFHNVAFLKNCVRFRIHPAWNLLIGFPREEAEVYQKYLEDIPLLAHLPPPAGAFPVRFDRYSPYFVRAEEYGLKLEPYDFYGFIYPFPKESLARMAYYFEDRNYRAAYLDQMVTWQGRLQAAVQDWSRRWRGADGRDRAVLAVEPADDGGAVITDTRFDEPREHRLTPLEHDLLNELGDKGWKPEAVARRRELEPDAVTAAIERLDELSLLFHENGRYSSLAVAAGDDAGLDRSAGDITFADPAARFGRESFA